MDVSNGDKCIISRDETNYLKAIAIILIVWVHVWGTFGHGNEQIRNLIGTGGVCLFLILSGYGIYMSYVEKGLTNDYWNKKINKIFIPYWLTTLIYVVLCRKDVSAIILMKNLLCVDYERNIDGTMWYMSLLLIFYILFFIVFKVKLNDIIKIGFLFLAAFCIKERAQQSSFSACSWQFLNNYLSFPIGVLLGWLFAHVRIYLSKLKGNLIRLATLAVCVIAYYSIFKRNPGAFQSLGIFFSFAIIIFVNFISSNTAWGALKVLKWIGINSYIIYW